MRRVHCPQSEIRVLDILKDADEMTGPQISRSSNSVISKASIYRLLGRLQARKLVTSTTKWFEVCDVNIKRVVYTTTFDKMEKVD
jgi:DNA-binding PadR family transcriptional regulator